jgi:hypothetical protein
MNLSEFVESTLLEIMDGVSRAQDQWHACGRKGHVNPHWGGYEQGEKTLREVAFDVAVTVEDGTAKEAKGGLRVVSIIEAGGSAKAESKSSSVSRVSFSVPISPPVIYIEVDGPPPLKVLTE